MKIKRLIVSVMISAGLMLASVGVAGQQEPEELREEFHQIYPLSTAGGKVSLENINGAVNVRAWDRPEVRVDAVKRAYTRERLDEVKIEVEAGADAIRIKTVYPRHMTSWTDNQKGKRLNPASVDYMLTVPRGALLNDIKSINGAVDLEDLTGNVTASSINGRVTARRLTGVTKLSVINGRLEASFEQFDESKPISLTAVNGPLVLIVPSDANLELWANTVHGGITNDFGLPVRRGEYVGHDLAGVIGAGGARIRLANVNGPISVRRAADNRPLSPARNLLSEARRDDRGKAHEKEHSGEVERAARMAARAAERAAGQSERELERAARLIERSVERAAESSVRTSVSAKRVGSGPAGEGSANRDGGDSRRIDRTTKSLPVSGTPRLRLTTFDGNIVVRAWDKPEVMYTVVKRAADEREMQGVRVEATQNGAEITINAEFDKNFSREVVKRDERVVAFSSNASVELDLYVPRASTLQVSSGDGRLRVEGVSGDVDLRTGGGPVDVRGGRGRLRVETNDGQIRIVDFDGSVDARTGDGRITLDGRFDQLAATTSDGSIALALPADANVTIETNAETVSSDGMAVPIDPETFAGRPTRRWRIGRGGQIFTLHSGDGSIILRRR